MFNIKTLVAVAALAAAGAASANVIDANATTAGGEMSFTVWSESAGVSFLFDTGLTVTNFYSLVDAAGEYTFSADLSNNTEFTRFLTLAGNAADISVAFWGGDNSGSTAAGRTMVSTLAPDVDVTLIKSGNMVDSMNQLKNNYLDTANLTPLLNASNPANLTGNATFVKGVDGNAYVGEVIGADFTGNFQPTFGLAGTNVDVYKFVRSGTSGLSDAIETKIGVASLNGTNLKFTTAVPEPESYALVLVGLACAVGARRRLAK